MIEALGAEGLLRLLPWRHPFLLIDRMVECVPHERIVTEKRVTAGDPLLGAGAAPSASFPAFLLLEGLGQSAALLFRLSYGESPPARVPLLGFLEATLHGSAAPGDLVTFEVRSAKMTRTGGVFEGRASHGSAILAEAELAFSARGKEGDGEADV